MRIFHFLSFLWLSSAYANREKWKPKRPIKKPVVFRPSMKLPEADILRKKKRPLGKFQIVTILEFAFSFEVFQRSEISQRMNALSGPHY